MLICSLAVMIYPPLTFSYGNWDTWIYRGLIFLIIACPTGLVMSVPIAFLGGIASAARHGIVVKGGNYLEDLAKADTFIFDKTGTLTGTSADRRACGVPLESSDRPVSERGLSGRDPGNKSLPDAGDPGLRRKCDL